MAIFSFHNGTCVRLATWHSSSSCSAGTARASLQALRRQCEHNALLCRPCNPRAVLTVAASAGSTTIKKRARPTSKPNGSGGRSVSVTIDSAPADPELEQLLPPLTTPSNNIVSAPGAVSGEGSVSGAHHTHRALVLDSAYRPINVISWFKAVTMDLAQKVDVLDYYEGAFAVSAYRLHPLPAVVRVCAFVDMHEVAGKVSLTRRNIMLRDRHTCQYCGAHKELTIDHVVPQCKGGKNTWTNLVTACMRCNQRKGHATLAQLGWRLRIAPREPTPYEVGIILGLSSSDVERPPAPWAPYLQPYKEKLDKVKQRRSAAAAAPAGTAAGAKQNITAA